MRKEFMLSLCLIAGSTFIHAQTLEFSSGNGPAGMGPSTTTQTVNFSRNTDNPSGNTFVAPSPAISVGVTLNNQQYTTSAQPGIVFGASVSNTNPSLVPENIYSEFSSVGNPTNEMFSAAAPANSGGINTTGAASTQNYALRLVMNANYLAGQPLNSRHYYGDITLTFSRPVTNPVIQLAGMGAANNQHGHSVELRLKNPDLGVSRLDGNQFFAISDKDIMNSSNAITGSAQTGSASGSAQVEGTNITSVTLEVYLRGDANGTQWQSNNGIAGDVFLLGVSLPDIITLSGNIFYDVDGMNDALVDNNSNAQAYPFSAGQVKTNLFDSSGKFVASVPVSATGMYSLSVAPNTNYTVVISTEQGSSGVSTTANFLPSLPARWAVTGEQMVVTSHNIPDGSIAVPVIGTSITNVNFGINPLPQSYNETNEMAGIPITGTDYSLSAVPMEGSEDSTAGNTRWAGKKLVITSLPDNNFELRYNGVLITAANIGTTGFVINSYDSSMFRIRPTLLTPIGATITSFQYTIIDSAGLRDPSPATYTVSFSIPLPIELVAFNAAPSCPGIQLMWETALERNIKLIELQVSGDGASFNTIAKHLPKGNNSRYTDTYSGKNGDYFFRLKITEQDETFFYSRVTTATLNCGQSFLEAYPVPLRGNMLTLKYSGTTKTGIAFYDATGRMIKTVMLQPGNNEIETGDLSNGNYWLKLQEDGTKQKAIQIIKQ